MSHTRTTWISAAIAIVAVCHPAAGSMQATDIGATDPQPGSEAGVARGADRFPALDWLVGEWQGYGEFAHEETIRMERVVRG